MYESTVMSEGKVRPWGQSFKNVHDKELRGWPSFQTDNNVDQVN